jgi:hypothetical protein
MQVGGFGNFFSDLYQHSTQLSESKILSNKFLNLKKGILAYPKMPFQDGNSSQASTGNTLCKFPFNPIKILLFQRQPK